MAKDPDQGAAGAGPNPMEEENFPTNNPTRKSADKNMREPSNVRGSRDPVPDKGVPNKEAGDGMAGDAGVQGDAGGREA